MFGSPRYPIESGAPRPGGPSGSRTCTSPPPPGSRGCSVPAGRARLELALEATLVAGSSRPTTGGRSPRRQDQVVRRLLEDQLGLADHVVDGLPSGIRQDLPADPGVPRVGLVRAVAAGRLDGRRICPARTFAAWSSTWRRTASGRPLGGPTSTTGRGGGSAGTNSITGGTWTSSGTGHGLGFGDPLLPRARGRGGPSASGSVRTTGPNAR